jgi:prepilin-type N-terminal cleavage/methylation domain-containing protein/prepilin-type processing-associated H-X9-DG protein
MRRDRRSHRGFTLIELLVVVAIIAILAAILFPVFAQAREKARQATCTSNVKQLTLGVTMYVQDYDETFPLMWNPGPPLPPDQTFYGLTPTVWTWQNNAMAYVKNYTIHQCPSGWSQRSTWKGIPHRANGGYGGNREVFRYAGADGVCRMAMIKEPAATYMVMDGGNYTADCGDYQEARHPSNAIPGARWNEKCFNSTLKGTTRTCRGATRDQAVAYWRSNPDKLEPADAMVRDMLDGRHNRHITVAFADGHVKTMDPDQALFNQKGWFDPPSDKRCVGNPPPY